MTVIGISMFKNEEDIAEGVLRHMAGEVDRLVVADNLSTDSTRQILDGLVDELPLTIVEDPDPAHYQSRKMSGLAARFADPGDWIVPFDADELWYSRTGRIRDVLQLMDSWPDGEHVVVAAALIDHFGTAVDERDPDVFRSFVWRKLLPSKLPKVAFRYEPGAVIADGNHGVLLPSGATIGSCTRQTACAALEIRHFPYRSPAQFVRKGVNGAAALALTDLSMDCGGHWRGYGAIAETYGVERLESVYRDYFWFLVPWEQGMVRDPAPYRRWEVR
jgi:hypothetical protein